MLNSSVKTPSWLSSCCPTSFCSGSRNFRQHDFVLSQLKESVMRKSFWKATHIFNHVVATAIPKRQGSSSAGIQSSGQAVQNCTQLEQLSALITILEGWNLNNQEYSAGYRFSNTWQLKKHMLGLKWQKALALAEVILLLHSTQMCLQL